MNANGSGKRDLGPGCCASYSPDGDRLLFTRDVDSGPALNNDVFVSNADGSSAANLTASNATNDSAPQFSPDGRRIVFRRDVDPGAGVNTDVLVMNADGSDAAPIVTGAASEVPTDWEHLFRCAGRAATIVGSDSGEKLKGTKRADVIVANGGNDTVRGGGGKDRICGGKGRDKLIGGGARDILRGGAGKDRQIQ